MIYALAMAALLGVIVIPPVYEAAQDDIWKATLECPEGQKLVKSKHDGKWYCGALATTRKSS